jgi:hypothetical protein
MQYCGPVNVPILGDDVLTFFQYYVVVVVLDYIYIMHYNIEQIPTICYHMFDILNTAVCGAQAVQKTPCDG